MDPENLTHTTKGFNLVNGEWTHTVEPKGEVVDPMNGKVMYVYPETPKDKTAEFINELKNCPKTGLHNPFKNKERYLMLGEVNRRLVEAMSDPDVYRFFVR